MDHSTPRGREDPLQITPGDAGRLIVRIPYSSERVAKMKTIAGRRWHQGEKHWTVPHSDDALRHLLALFAGEPVEVDPSLRSENISDNNQLSEKLASDPQRSIDFQPFDRVRRAIRSRHYSYRTEKAYIHWIKRFAFFYHERHLSEIGEAEIGRDRQTSQFSYLPAFVCHPFA